MHIDHYNNHFMFETIEIKEVKEEIGQIIKQIRKNRNLSQVALSKSLNVSRTTIQNLESGKNFTIDTIFKVLKEFDILDNVHHEIVEARKQISTAKSLY